MKNHFLLSCFFLLLGISLFACKNTQTITPNKASSTLPFFVTFSLTGNSTNQLAVYYQSASQKHYLSLYSLVGDTLLHKTPYERDTVIAYGNFRSHEMFYRASDSVLSVAQSSSFSSLPININNLTVEVYDNNHTLLTTHNLYLKVHVASGFQYTAKWDGVSLQQMSSFQSTGNQGRIGFVVP